MIVLMMVRFITGTTTVKKVLTGDAPHHPRRLGELGVQPGKRGIEYQHRVGKAQINQPQKQCGKARIVGRAAFHQPQRDKEVRDPGGPRQKCRPGEAIMTSDNDRTARRKTSAKTCVPREARVRL